MLSLLSWIPLLGPILSGIGSIVSNFTNLAAVKLKTSAQVDIATTQTAAQIIATTNDDILLRILRDMAILPVVVWSMLIGWDTIIVHAPWETLRDLAWPIPAYPPSVGYLPYVVLVFLFGNIGLNAWRNK